METKTFLHFCLVVVVAVIHLSVVNSAYPKVKVFAGGGYGEGELAINGLVDGSFTFDSKGDMYVAQSSLHLIARISNGIIMNTVAGTGYWGYNGDGILATNAQLNNPSVVFHSNEMFISDSGNNRIRKVFTNGTITTIAGTGEQAYGGDGGLATNAQLNTPTEICFSLAGEIYIADANNNRIRKVFTNGTITTIAGTGEKGYGGDGDWATNAKLWGPRGVYVTSTGVVYITDTFNNRIRKIDTNGTITTIAGTGEKGYGGDGDWATNAQLNTPTRITMSTTGELYVGDSHNRRIRKIDTNGKVSTIAGTGESGFSEDGVLATSAKLNMAINPLVTSTGELYFSDNSRIRKIVTNGTLKTVAGIGGKYYGYNQATTAKLENSPSGVAVGPNGDVYIADVNNFILRKVDRKGKISTIAGNGVYGDTGDGGLATNAQLSPYAVAVSSSGEIFIADKFAHKIRKIFTNGTIITYAGTGVKGLSGNGGPATNANLDTPQGIAIGPTGEVYVSDPTNQRVRKILTNGTIINFAGTGYGGNSGDGGPATEAKLTNPFGITVSSIGEVFFLDNNCRVRKVDTNGTITRFAGTGYGGFSGDGGLATNAEFSGLSGISINSDGELYISDTKNNRIRKIFTNGTVTTVAGSVQGYNNVEDPSAVYLNGPTGIAATNGKVYFADTQNAIVRVLVLEPTYCYGILDSDPDVCNGNGACLMTDSCICNENYFGAKCLPSCFGHVADDNTTQVCRNNGKCVSPDTCQCNDGWYGSDCGTPTCFGSPSYDSMVCSSHGRCISNNTCSCDNGWTGLNCSIPLCYGLEIIDPHVCSCHGSCISNNTCLCDNGWTGLNCSIPLCYGLEIIDPHVCSSHGSCISNNTCSCNRGWSGEVCEITLCFNLTSNDPHVCNGNGMCENLDNCKCESGWTGLNCSTHLCYGLESSDPLVCSSRGQCVSNDTCSCVNGWTGLNCSNPICYDIESINSFVCSSHGNCISNNSCHCNSGWTGLNCSTPLCYGLEGSNPLVCSSHGYCITNNTCHCSSGWTGLNCSTPFCYGLEGSNPLVCSSHGHCILHNTCSCDNGWTGLNCSTPLCYGLEGSNPLVCSSHGSCISNNTCSCNRGWSGEVCEITLCFNLTSNDPHVCNGNGMCENLDNCKCESGWTGLNCSTHLCYGLESSNPLVCSSHGYCISNNTCHCSSGWTGSNCSNPICYDIESINSFVCSSHGNCISNNSCHCNSGWTGLNCSTPLCYGLEGSNPLACSSHGHCISNNTCSCSDSWFGHECEITKCYGEIFNSSNVCSSHGTCIGPNKCECKEGWEGLDCSQLYCFNVNSVNHTVCSSHGNCISNNTCVCQYGWYGNDCSILSCFGIYNNTNLVCSGHGSCQDVDLCQCEPKWKGLQCSVHTCNGVEYNNTKVCSGHGSCVQTDKCVCESGWNGNDCSLHSCNEIPQNGANVCSGHGTCSTMNKCDCQNGYEGVWCEFYYCKGKLVNISTICEDSKPCSSLLNCSGNGDCNSIGDCKCYSNSSKGFWKNQTCNECQENYYGKECLTSFKGPVRYLDDFTGISFTLYGNLKADQNIDCSFILKSSEMYLFGSKPTCKWIYSSSQFYIKFGNDYQLSPNMLIHLNMLVFDSIIIHSEKFISDIVFLPLNPINPTAQIYQTRSEYGSCEEIIIDGSPSFSPDNKPLIYIWTISHTSNSVVEKTNSSFITLPTSATSGEYSISLKVVSLLSGLESPISQVSFNKKQISFPIVSIVGGNYVSKILSQIPAVIGTVVSLPDCISNSSSSLSYNWEKLTGPELTMISNSKDLIITEFKEKISQSYTFKLTVTSLENVDMIVSTLIYLNTTPEPFSTILYVSELTTEQAVLGAEFSTALDLSIETFKWTCLETAFKSCENSINSALESFSLSKSTLISIPKTTQNITLTLQVRDVISTIDIVFPTNSKQVAPLINLLMVNPSDRIVMRSVDILNLQLSVSINGVEEGIDLILERMWTLNGQSIPSSYISPMKTGLSKSNYIILDISQLEKGAEYTLQFQATNLESSLTSSYTFKFSVTKPIPICVPTSSLTSAYALETKITLSLPNCKLESSMEPKFYFLDEQSGAKLHIATGSQITTLLPLSQNNDGVLTIISVITEKTTGETSQGSINIETLVPLAKTLKELKVKQKSWTTQVSLLLPGDPQMNVLNSGSISYVVQRMMSSSLRRRSNSCQNGVLNLQTQTCTCNQGYAKLDCSITVEEWIERKELMDSLALLFSNSYYSRNKYEKMSESYLLSQIFSMRNILRVIDELSSESIDSILTILEEVTVNSVNNKNLPSPVGLEDLLLDVINHLYRYRQLVLKEETLTSAQMNVLMNITLDMSNFMIRNKNIGGDSLKFNTDFIKITTNRVYPRDLSGYLLDQSNTTSIKLPNGMMKYVETAYSKRKPLTLRLTNTNKFNRSSYTIISNLVTFEVLEFPLLNITERIDFRMEFMPLSKTDPLSSSVCAILTIDEVWDSSKCLTSTKNDSNMVDCLCSQQGSVSVLSKIHKEQSDILSPTTSLVPANTSSKLELLALISLIVLVVIVCVLIALVTFCIIRKKRGGKSKPTRTIEKELVTV